MRPTHLKSMVVVLSLVAAAGLTSAGCLWTSATARDPAEPTHLRKNWDYSDLKGAVEKISQGIVTSRNLAGLAKKPVIVVYGIQNDTDDHDVKTNLISDKIQTSLNETGAVDFVDKAARTSIDLEIAYQGGKVDPATATRVGKQLGATHVLVGTLASMDAQEGKGIRASKKSLKFYNLTVRLTNLETGKLDYSGEFEVAREESRPLIGW